MKTTLCIICLLYASTVHADVARLTAWLPDQNFDAPIESRVVYDPHANTLGHNAIVGIQRFDWDTGGGCTFQAGHSFPHFFQTWTYDGAGWLDLDDQTWSLSLEHVVSECGMGAGLLDFTITPDRILIHDSVIGVYRDAPAAGMELTHFVPEPSSIVLAAIGLLLACNRNRRC